MEKKLESFECQKCGNLYDTNKHLPRNLGIPCKHIICDFCVKEIFKKMKTDTFTFSCPSQGCFRQIRPESRYMSKCFDEDTLTSELVKKSKNEKKIDAEKESDEKERDQKVDDETNKNGKTRNEIKKDMEIKEDTGKLKIKTEVESQAVLLNKLNEKTEGTEQIENKTQIKISNNIITGKIKDENKSIIISIIESEVLLTKKETENKLLKFDDTENLKENTKVEKLKEKKKFNTTKITESFEKYHENQDKVSQSNNESLQKEILLNDETLNIMEENKILIDQKLLDTTTPFQDSELELIPMNQLNTGEELLLTNRMTSEFTIKSRRSTGLKLKDPIDAKLNQESSYPNLLTGLPKTAQETNLPQIQNIPERLFSATLVQTTFKNVRKLLEETELSEPSFWIDHFPKSFETHESNIRTITVEKWLFSRKIIPSFFYNCIQFSRSSTSKSTSLHTVMDVTPITAETFIKLTLLKYDASESSHFGFCDKNEALALQENKMRFNPEQPHCYITDGYSKFKISENEFSALSWKSSKGSCFQSGDEIYIHVIPKKSIIFYLKRQNVSIKYKDFDKFCDIRFFMTIVMRTNVFEYKRLI